MHRVVIVFVAAVLISWTYGCVETPTEAPKCVDIPSLDSSGATLKRKWILSVDDSVTKQYTWDSLRFSFVMLTDSNQLLDFFSEAALQLGRGFYQFNIPETPVLPPQWFIRVTGSRVALFAILLYKDTNNDSLYGHSDVVLGCSSLLARTRGNPSCMVHEWCQFSEEGLYMLTVRDGTYQVSELIGDNTSIELLVKGSEQSYEIPRPWISASDTLIFKGSKVVRK